MKKTFNTESALELLDNDKDLLNILVNAFVQENKFEKEILDKLISEKKLSEAASYVHATKGAARQLCMEKLTSSGQDLEDVLRGKKSGNIPELESRMFADYKEALEAALIYTKH